MLRDTMSGKLLDPEVAACSRRAREKESAAAIEATCRTQQRLQALWWRAFGAGRTIVVGDSALKRGQVRVEVTKQGTERNTQSSPGGASRASRGLGLGLGGK